MISYVHYCPGIYYINAYGNEIHPYPNPDFLTNISLRQVLVYSCGSLWTRSVTGTTFRSYGLKNITA